MSAAGQVHSAAPSIARVQLEAQVHQLDLRRDDAASVMDSMESSSSIWSMRILAEARSSASVASASKTRSSGRGPADEAAAGAAGALQTTSGAGDSCFRLVFIGSSRVGVGGEATPRHHARRWRHCAVGVFRAV